MRRKKQNNTARSLSVTPIVGACLGSAILAGLPVGNVQAQDAGRLEKLEKENAELKARLDALDGKGEGAKSYIVKAMNEISISGFVQASYFYNTAKPADGVSDAYLWNSVDNAFSLNKFKLTVASKPVATDKWDAGFKASLIFGEDAPQLNTAGANGTGGGANTSFNDLREAYVEINAPIGTGLNIKAGELISLLNYESGDGGAANVNFSQGNQWWYTGNGPSAGIQAAYNFTEKVGLVLRLDNGLYQGPVDNNSGKAFSTSLNLKPTSKLWANIYAFWDDQPADTDVKGFGTIGGFQITDKLGTGWEFDYFNFDAAGNHTDVWSIGSWTWYDFSPTAGIAFRADFIDSHGGVLGPAMRGAGSGITTTDTDGNLASFTLTYNWKPASNLKIQPEIRLDTTSFAEGLDTHGARLIVGLGATYMF